MALNAQQKRVSKNRVSITFDVEDNGVVETKEMPFVIRIVGGYSGDRTDREDADQRRFHNIDKDNFNNVLAEIAPRLTMKVDNKIEDTDSQIEVDLNFKNMKDFTPDAVVESVEPLRKLANTRQQLMTLLGKADRSKDLERLLKEILKDDASIKSLSEELGVGKEE